MKKDPRATTADGAVVEYGLVRHALLSKIAAGVLRREDVCDAHPELLRAATNIGRRTGEQCTNCKFHHLVRKWAAGGKLARGQRRVRQ